MTEEKNSVTLKPISVIVDIEINEPMSISSAFILGTQAAMRLGVDGVRFDHEDLVCRACWDGSGTAHEWGNEEKLVGIMPMYSPTFEWTEYGERLMAERREAAVAEERAKREAEGMRNSYVPRAVLDAEGNHVPNCGCPECQAKCTIREYPAPLQTQWWEYAIATIGIALILWAFYSLFVKPSFSRYVNLRAQSGTVEFAASGINDEIDMWQRIIDGRRHALKWAQEQGLTPVRVECELSRCVVEAPSESWYLQGCLSGECEIRQRNFETAKPLPDGYCWDCLSGQCKAVPCAQ